MTNKDLCLKTAEWLLPGKDANLAAWACVACDQYTSQRSYWAQARELAGDRPSAVKLILPECDLEKTEELIPQIHAEMEKYLADGILHPAAEGFILTERRTESGIRKGLVVLLDLEGYDYSQGSQSLIRPTEGTIVDRIPPRLKVRRKAALELSHVMVLLDDPLRTVVEPLYQRRHELKKLYDFSLMLGGGHLTGYAVTDPGDIEAVVNAIARLKAGETEPDALEKGCKRLHKALKALKLNKNTSSQRKRPKAPLLYAMGDGNHSLATAKACWEEIKQGLPPGQREDHPARYAMAELVNLHNEALAFEPIHRVVFGIAGDDLLADMAEYAANHGLALTGGDQKVVCVYGGKEVALAMEDSAHRLIVGTLQSFLDEWLQSHPEAKLDYVHGESAVRDLAGGERTVGFLLPPLEKAGLFPAIHSEGVLPRKTFSMGEAHEKRYYVEARRL